MNEKSYFLDSNIWLYGLMFDPDSNREEEIRKHSLAIQLTEVENNVISNQVINEICCVLRRKAAFAESQIKQIIQEFYDRCTVVELNFDILVNASDLRNRYGFSFWDGLIVASALHANTDVLYSEDMQSGLKVCDRLEIVNPFKSPLK
jgi:predicted nucleic acid-binding protein